VKGTEFLTNKQRVNIANDDARHTFLQGFSNDPAEEPHQIVDSPSRNFRRLTGPRFQLQNGPFPRVANLRHETV